MKEDIRQGIPLFYDRNFTVDIKTLFFKKWGLHRSRR
jgi:hypothetical protein